jgi:hypothetical protein
MKIKKNSAEEFNLGSMISFIIAKNKAKLKVIILLHIDIFQIYTALTSSLLILFLLIPFSMLPYYFGRYTTS